MKFFLKFIFLLLFSLLFLVVSILLQTSLTINNTIFSDVHFNRVFDNNITPNKIEDLTNKYIEKIRYSDIFGEEDKISIEEKNKIINNYQESLKENIDIEWIKTETPNTIKKSYAYLTNNEKTLPTINIKPLKNSIIKIFTDQILLQANNSGIDINELITQLKKESQYLIIDGKPNQDIIDDFISSDFAKSINLDKDTAEDIIVMLNETENEDNVLELFVKKIIINKLNINDMKDELDLNLLINNIYDDNNPIDTVKNNVNNIRINISNTITIIFISLMLIISLILFKLKTSSKLWGTLLTISGLITFILMLFYQTTYASNISKIITLDSNLEIFENFFISYINEISNYIIIQSIIFISLGIILIIIGIIIKKKEQKKSFILIRLTAFAILISTIVLTTINSINYVQKEIKELNIVLNPKENNIKDINIIEALDKTLNTNFFSSIVNEENK